MYRTEQPTPEEVAALEGLTILEFGTNWCGVCQAARADIREGLGSTDVPYIKVEDGRGRPLGRSFRVKLWPTLIFLRDGLEVSRVVRPRSPEDVSTALSQLLKGA